MYAVHEVNDYESGKMLAIMLKKDGDLMSYGTKFLTPEWSQQQVGFIKRDDGFEVPWHTHRKQERSASETAEVLVVLKGKIQVKVCNSSGKFCGSLVAHQGDIVVLMLGGHSIEFLMDSELLEVKTGPYVGRANDKIDIQVRN